MLGIRRVLLLTALIGLPAGASAEAIFFGLGDLPGGATSSMALGVSPDGRVVVGQSDSASGPEAFRWRQDLGLHGLGFLPNPLQPESRATDASIDGSVIVGGSFSDGSTGFGFRWTESGGMVGLGPPIFPGDTTGGVRRSSGDGDLLVGDLLFSLDHDFQWTPTGGFEHTFSFLQAERVCNLAVSTDGSTVAGSSFNLDGSFDTLAHRNYQTVPVPANPFTGLLHGEVAGVNADGSVLVGQSVVFFDPTTAFRWEGGALQALGTLGGSLSRAVDVSGDGALVIGWADTATSREAFLWDAVGGMRSLASELVGVHGLDLSGWTLDEATAISDDGRVIVGFGSNPSGDPEGFMAVLETECSNGLDDDGDGNADLADFGCDDAFDLSEKTPFVACDNGSDDDGDGFTDFPADPGCKNALWNFENPVCQNGLDDDGDGLIDFDGGATANGGEPLADPDPDCRTPWQHKETAGGRCGLGPELALVLLALIPLRRRRPASRSRSGPWRARRNAVQRRPLR